MIEFRQAISPRNLSFGAVLLTLASAVSCGPSKPDQDGEPAATPAGEPSGESASTLGVATAEAGPQTREEQFPTFGVALTPPEGWKAEALQPQVGFLARWLPENARADDWSQFTVETQMVEEGVTARQAATMFERRGYVRTQTRLGGGPAERLDAPEPEPGAERKPTASPIIIARRGGRIWRLVFLFNDPSGAAEVDEVVRSWRWTPLQPVGEHLELGPPQQLFDGVGTVRLPAISRRDPTFAAENTVAFTSFDYANGQDAIITVCYYVPAREKDSLSGQAVLYAEVIEERTKLGELLRFGPAEGRNNLYVSEIIRGEFPSEIGPVSRYSQYAVWQPSPDCFIRMQSVINDEVFAGEAALDQAVRAVAMTYLSCSPLAERPAASEPAAESVDDDRPLAAGEGAE